MSAAFTVCLPHKRNPGNDRALSICLDCLMTNTAHDFNLLIDAAYDAPLYPRINRLFAASQTDCIVYMASDMFLAPRWDDAMYALWRPDLIVTNVVVEPGAIATHHLNLCRDFGRKPETFRRGEFEAWCESEAPVPSGEGWFCPYMISKTAFFELGGMDIFIQPGLDGFSGADMDFFTRWKQSGRGVERVRSFVYHLQRYSDENEQTKEGR